MTITHVKEEIVRKMSLSIEDVLAKRTADEPTMADCVESAVQCYEIFKAGPISVLEGVLRELLEHSYEPVGTDVEYLKGKHVAAVRRGCETLGIDPLEYGKQQRIAEIDAMGDGK